MSFSFAALAILAQGILVLGQVLLKRAMILTAGQSHWRRRFALLFGLAISSMTLYFFLWLGILGYVPLSQLAPFDALGPVLLVIVVHFTLRERLTLRAWLGVACILAGVSVIALS